MCVSCIIRYLMINICFSFKMINYNFYNKSNVGIYLSPVFHLKRTFIYNWNIICFVFFVYEKKNR